MLDCIDPESFGIPEALFSSQAEVFDLGFQGDAHLQELIGHAYFMNELLSLLEFLDGDFGPVRGSLVIHGKDDQFDLLQEIERSRASVDPQTWSHQDLSLFPTQKAFAIDVNACVQLVTLAQVLEPGEGGNAAVPQDCGPLPGPGAEGDRDHALFIRFVFLAVDPGGGLGAGLVRLVDDMEFVTGRSGFLEQAKGSLTDKDPAADPVSDELDDVHPALLELGESEGSGNPAHGSFLKGQRSLPGCGQAVQFDCGIDLPALAQVVVECVDLEFLDQKGLDVLGPELDLDLFAR